MNRHTLTLIGGAGGDELRVPAETLQEMIRLLLEGARGAVRLDVEGESVRRGQRPAWLVELGAIDITGLTAGSAIVALQAPSFGDLSEPALVGYEHVPGDQSAVDRFASILAAILDDDAEDVTADRSLLDICANFARASGVGFDGVRLDGLQGRSSPLTVRPSDVPRIEYLRDRTPPSRATRLTGRLDTISATRADIVLLLDDGSRLPARLDTPAPRSLGPLFDRDVTVSGTVHFNPSGRPRHLSVDEISSATQTDGVFRRLPVARERAKLFDAVPQDAGSGVNAFFGTWPGEESDDDLLDALRSTR